MVVDRFIVRNNQALFPLFHPHGPKATSSLPKTGVQLQLFEYFFGTNESIATKQRLLKSKYQLLSPPQTIEQAVCQDL